MNRVFKFLCEERNLDLDFATKEYEDILKVIVSQIVFINRELSFKKSLKFIFKNKWDLLETNYGVTGEIVDIIKIITFDWENPEKKRAVDKYLYLSDNLVNKLIDDLTPFLLSEKDNLKGEDELPEEYNQYGSDQFIYFNYTRFKDTIYNTILLNDINNVFWFLFDRIKQRYLKHNLKHEYWTFPWERFFYALRDKMTKEDKYEFFIRGKKSQNAMIDIDSAINDLIKEELKNKNEEN